MGELKFSDNYSDLCEQSGAHAGFQFEFNCERCGDVWRSEFQPFKAAQASEWLGRASGLFGGALGGLSDVAQGASDASWGTARDTAFRDAIEAAKVHFHRCPRCTDYFCDECWNAEAGLCKSCAPSAEVEIEAARAEGMVYAVGEKAALDGIRAGKKMDTTRRRQVVCPHCGAPNEGAKFCPECGAKLAVKDECPGCGAAVTAGAKFCPECGEKLGA